MPPIRQCDQCSHKFDTQSKLDKHVKVIHLKFQDFLCTACGTRFAHIEDFMKHVNKYNLTTADFWEIACSKFRKTPSQAFDHIDFDADTGLVQCTQCSFITDSLRKCKHHVERVHLKIPRFICYVCAKRFVAKSQMGRHFKDHHQDLRLYNLLCKSGEDETTQQEDFYNLENPEQDTNGSTNTEYLKRDTNIDANATSNLKRLPKLTEEDTLPTKKGRDRLHSSTEESTSAAVSSYRQTFNAKRKVINVIPQDDDVIPQDDDVISQDDDVIPQDDADWDSDESQPGFKCEVCPFTSDTADEMVTHINQAHLNDYNKKELADDMDMDDLDSNNDAEMDHVLKKIKVEKDMFEYARNPYSLSAPHRRANHMYTSNSKQQCHSSVADSVNQAVMLKCNQCSFQSTYKHSINRHIKSVHDAAKDYMCQNCGVAFTERRTLIKHTAKFTKLEANGDCHMTCAMIKESSKGSSTVKTKKKSHLQEISNQGQESDEYESYMSIEPEVCLDEGTATLNLYKSSQISTTDYDTTNESIAEDSNSKVYDCSYCPFKTGNKIFLEKHSCQTSSSQNSPKVTIKQELPYYTMNIKSEDTSQTTSGHHTSKSPRPSITIRFVKEPERHQCPHCSFKTHSLETVELHVQAVHLKLEEFSCTECHTAFTDKDLLSKHIQANRFITEDQTIQMLCSERKNIEEDIALPAKVYKCITCDQELYSNDDMSQHLSLVHNEINVHVGKLKYLQLQPYQCKDCPYKSKHTWKFRKHVKSVHLKQKQFLCTQCGKEYSEKRDFLNHDSTKCLEIQKVNIAKRSSKFRVLLKPYQHIKRSEETKLLQCIECNFESACMSTVMQHVIAVHSITNIFTCNYCQEEFSKMPKIIDHLNSAHNETCVVNNTVFECHECPAFPRSMVNLHAHVRGVHFKAWPYQCLQCPESFSTKQYLAKHIIMYHNNFDTSPNNIDTSPNSIDKSHNNIDTSHNSIDTSDNNIFDASYNNIDTSYNNIDTSHNSTC